MDRGAPRVRRGKAAWNCVDCYAGRVETLFHAVYGRLIIDFHREPIETSPAVTLAGGFTTTFAGIAINHVPAFIIAELIGAFVAALLSIVLFPSAKQRRARDLGARQDLMTPGEQKLEHAPTRCSCKSSGAIPIFAGGTFLSSVASIAILIESPWH
jgi:hypothetical protein